jgi:[histone H3]-lysine36 N-trimethyltransferase
VGFIGGKTQTDLGGMDDLYIDGKPHRLQTLKPASENPLALGIADEVERLGLKGNRRKKGKKLDEDFNVSIASLTLCSPFDPSF